MSFARLDASLNSLCRVNSGVRQFLFGEVMNITKQVISIALVALLLAGQNIATSRVERYRSITFEGTLLNYSPHDRIDCGVLYVHQVAKYRVDKILDGKYAKDEIVVDHPACSGDLFKDIAVGSHVKITVRVRRKYGVITMHPRIREEGQPKVFYVAEAPPEKIEN